MEDSVHGFLALGKCEVWQRIHDVLPRRVRCSVGKLNAPAAAILDSQSIRTAEGAKNGATMPAKRSPAASWMVVVHGAYWQDHDAACFVLLRLQAICR
jgi:hypothetical protein